MDGPKLDAYLLLLKVKRTQKNSSKIPMATSQRSEVQLLHWCVCIYGSNATWQCTVEV